VLSDRTWLAAGLVPALPWRVALAEFFTEHEFFAGHGAPSRTRDSG
jgi:hypothetical protein